MTSNPSWAQEGGGTTTGDDTPSWIQDEEAQPQFTVDDPAGDEESASGQDQNRALTTTPNTPTPNTPKSGKKKWDLKEILRRDMRLIGITVAILILMNVPFGRYILYPFTIFSTWIHEMCHGISALLIGGRINRLMVYQDGSGLAYTSIPSGNMKRAFVASAGYQGTAVVGCLLLLFRRTKRGPRLGMIILAAIMLLSTAIWMRNVFGFLAVALLGIILAICAWKLPSARMRDVYVCVAVTCSLNAITSMRVLFGNSMFVNGEASQSDAHTVADNIFGPFWFWATLWLIFGLVMTFVGLIFAVQGPDEVADFPCCACCDAICNKKK